jgi:hypothetical protein
LQCPDRYLDDLATIPLLRQQHIFRLHVAMNDACLMKRTESVQKLTRDVERYLPRESILFGLGARDQNLPQGPGVQVFHGVVGIAVVRFAALEDTRHVRVVHVGEQLGFLNEARRMLAGATGQQLDHHAAAHAVIERPVHLRHAAGAEGRMNAKRLVFLRENHVLGLVDHAHRGPRGL